jgi:multicomponent Na+:H+ antiporter subunit D
VNSLHALVVAPLLVPLASALACVAASRNQRIERAVSIIGALVLFACACALVSITASGEVLTARFGDWPAPFAIAFRIDRLSAAMVLISALIGVLAFLYFGSHEQDTATAAWSYPLMHGLLAGAGGAFCTADLFNLYVWYEVLLITALGLVTIQGGRAQLDAGLKYLSLNLFGTLLLLIAVTGLYGVTGQLNFDALGAALAAHEADPLVRALVGLLLASLCVKAGSFPFFAWLPLSYPAASPASQAMFSAITAKVGAYSVIRVIGEIHAADAAAFTPMLGWVAAVTMVTGVLGAAYHYDVRRILAFHSVSQIGYVLLAASIGGAAGFAASAFFILHHVVVKANLFLVGGLMARSTGTYDLRAMGGLHGSRPALALLFGISASSLVGIPPLSGFWAKVLVVRSSFAADHWVWGATALVVGALTLFSMSKIWLEAFWKPAPSSFEARGEDRLPFGALAACTTLAALAILAGLAPFPIIAFLDDAAAALPAVRSAIGGMP